MIVHHWKPLSFLTLLACTGEHQTGGRIVENFTFVNATKIVFGKGAEAETGKEVRIWSKKVLLHYGKDSIKKSGLYDRVTRSLKDAGVEWVDLPGVNPNPRLSLVREGIRLCREKGADFILGVGGGSVIDSAKAIAAGVPYKGDVWDFYMRKAAIQEMLPVGVVLTIPAAGSESSNGSVITNEEGWLKKDAGSELMRPKFAIMNPEVTFTLPPWQTACGVADIIAHIMERYFTNVTSVELTDRLSEATMKTIIRHGHHRPQGAPQLRLPGGDHVGRDHRPQRPALHRAGSADWGSHMIEHELSGIYDIAHGAGLAVIFPAWMKYVYHHDVVRFAKFASRVWGVDYCFDDPEKTALEGIRRMEAFFHELGLPVTLKELDIKADRFDEMAKKADLPRAAGQLREARSEGYRGDLQARTVTGAGDRAARSPQTFSQEPDFSERKRASSTFMLLMASCGGVGTEPPSRMARENPSNIIWY